MWLKRVKGSRVELLVEPVVERKAGKLTRVGDGRGIPTELDESFEIPDDAGEYLLRDGTARFSRASSADIARAKKAAEGQTKEATGQRPRGGRHQSPPTKPSEAASPVHPPASPEEA